MSAPIGLRTLLWLMRDTFRQAAASRIFWLMLGVSAIGIMLCASISIDGPRTLLPPDEIELYGGDDQPLTAPNPNPGRLTIGFGGVSIPLFRGTESQMHFLYVLLAKWIAGAAGTMLALVWTAGFLPEFLQPSAASVLLAKPVPRWSLLVGKYLGVLSFVAFHTVVFVGGTWLALELRTGFWMPGYLWTIPLLLLHFAIIYSASAMLATYTLSTVTSMFGSIVFWLICFLANYARQAAATVPVLTEGTGAHRSAFGRSVDLVYWLLPKPADLVLLLDHVLESGSHFSSTLHWTDVSRSAGFSPALSVLSSVAFAVVMLAIAARHFQTQDY